MKIKKLAIATLCLLLCAAVVLPFVYVDVEAESVNFDVGNVGTGFKGKKISILGDSISTYEGVSNDGSANSTIANNAVYYKENNDYGVVREDTWWQQAIDKLDMELCVNNSWSGSGVMGWDDDDDGTKDYTDYTYAAKSRAQQLHTASANPDIVAVYLGTNDIKNATSDLSTFAKNQDTMLTEAAGTATSSVNKFSLYIRMVNKIMAKYPNAQIYLFTLLPNETQNDIQIRAMEQYNQSIRDLVTYYQGQSKKVYLVDLYNDTSITRDFNVLKKHLANTLHPNDAGMDVITNCFLSSLVYNSGWAQNPANWREVEYDLTDVYVAGGQINTKRFSSSTDNPISVSLVPTRSEYGMEVSVKAHKKGAAEEDTAANWDDITDKTYSGGTVFIRQIYYGSYDKIKITAKAVYQPKNFRWELGSSGLESCVMDGSNYNINGTLTQNNLTLENGSYNGTTFSKAQYKLGDSILLRNEEPWVVEWKMSGAFTSDHMLFSEDSVNDSRSNCYFFSDNGRKLYLGYRNGYRSQFWNYGVTLPDSIVLNADTVHTYRLANTINADGTNMPYLYVDGTKIGPMNNYAIGGTAQTGELATQTFLRGRDLEFNFLGAAGHYLSSCNIEYIQVWEGGSFDTLRLEQLVNEYDRELSTTMASATNFAAYKTAVENGRAFLNSTDSNRTQGSCDYYVTQIEKARNNLTKAADATEIISVELLTHNYVPIGKQTGLKIITTPDVQKIQVGNSAQTLLTNSSSLQTLTIDGVERQVKVWLVSWLRKDTTQKVVQYRIHALKDASVTASKDAPGDASVLFEVPYGSNCLALIKVTKQPDKVNYFVGEKFDKTGMEVTAYYGDGSTSEVITDYTVTSAKLTAADTYVTIKYRDSNYGDVNVSVDLPIDVMVNVSELPNYELGTNLVVYGYFAGVAQEGMSGDNEMLIKDAATDDIIALRGWPGEFPDDAFEKGALLKVHCTYLQDTAAATPNKRYLQFSEESGNVHDMVFSWGNKITYKLDNVVQVNSWAEMQALFVEDTIPDYTYIQFNTPVYLSKYVGNEDKTPVYRVHMNGSAAAAADIKCDGKAITLRSNVMEKNLGANWLDQFSLTGSGTFPGQQTAGGLIALYTGGNNTYFQLTVLDSTWIITK